MIGIYKIINPVGKIYVGQTTDYNIRLNNYKNLNCKNQAKLYNSIKKYGFENHIFEFLEECSILDLNTKERYYQDYYDVCDRYKGLNLRLTKSNDKSGRSSKETRLKQSINISKAKKDKKFKFSNESKEKMRLSALKRGNNKPTVKVIDINTKIVYDSIKIACKDLNINYNHIFAKLKGKKINNTGLMYYKEPSGDDVKHI